MTRRSRGLNEDERKLWTGITRSVVPLRARPMRSKPGAETAAAAPPVKPAAKKAPPAASPRPPAKPPTPNAPPLVTLDRRFKQRIARGSAAIEARLDLHGMTQAEAHDELLRFLRGAQGKGATVALVITGKGARYSGARGDGAREPGILKRQVPLWLRLPELRDYVVGFEEAGAAHGGAGALYVRLRKKRNSTR